MFSAALIFEIGLAVSAINIVLWIIIVRSQIKQFNRNPMNERIKISLLIFGITSLVSNIIPIWYDIFGIIHHLKPTNIGAAYVISQYLTRTIAAIMFYIIYRF